jgi:hypothetical protein
MVIVRRKNARSNPHNLLRYHPVRPLNQRNKYRRVTEPRSIVVQVRLRHTSGTRARAAGIDLNMLRHDLIQRLADWWPSYWCNSVGERLSHQPNRLPQQKNLHLVSCFRQCQSMEERKRSFGWIVRPPRALHHDLERLVRSLSPQRTTSRCERQRRQLRKS